MSPASSKDPQQEFPDLSRVGPCDDELADFCLFEQEKQVLRRTEQMLGALDDVADGVRMLAKAYSESYRVQRRMMRMSDRMQADLQVANRQLREQAGHLEALNRTLSDEVRERQRLTVELERLALEDELTGLFSRRRVMECVGSLATRVGETSTSLALMMLDLDQFKALNDSHGHAAGDYALKSFADVLRRELSSQQYAGRMGGEEFLVVAADLDPAAALNLAERIRQVVAGMTLEWNGNPMPMAVSIGLVVVTEHWPDSDALVALADDLLYRAKHEGRNRVVHQFPGAHA